MYALLAPGQGAQTPRMFRPWLRDPRTACLLASWSHAADVDLVHLGTKAGAEEIAQTENTQPLLVAQAMIILDYLPLAAAQWVVAGHSVGELAAAAFAGVLAPEDAVSLARARGMAMAHACSLAPTTMAAVIGGAPEVVISHLHGIGLTVANHNGAGQVVAAGLVEDVECLKQDPPKGTAVRQLAVAGAFHTSYMQSAQTEFAAAADRVRFRDAVHPMLSNLDGRLVTAGAEIRERLVTQLTSSVHWDLCLASLGELSPELVVAAPPGRVVTGMVTRQLPELRTLCVQSPRDLQGLTPHNCDFKGAKTLSGVGA